MCTKILKISSEKKWGSVISHSGKARTLAANISSNYKTPLAVVFMVQLLDLPGSNFYYDLFPFPTYDTCINVLNKFSFL